MRQPSSDITGKTLSEVLAVIVNMVWWSLLVIVVGIHVAPISYAVLLSSIPLLSRRLFGNRWLGFFALLYVGAITEVTGSSVNLAMESLYPGVLIMVIAYSFAPINEETPWKSLVHGGFW